MNSTQIEEMGINQLEHFFLKTKIVRPVLKKMDKYPIWDGELIIYNDLNYDKNNIKFRVPVQVKTELLKNEKNIEQAYSVELCDLEKYSTEGGVLFIKIVYNENKDESYFYMKNIMKGEINDILRNIHKGQKTKKILLYEVHVEDIIPLCMNFNLHREFQMQLPIISDDNMIKNGNLHTFGYINKINDILRTEQYAYVKTNFNLYAYVGKISFDFLYDLNNVEIATKVKKYYDTVIAIYKKDKVIIKINDYVKIFDKKICIDSDINLNSTLEKAIYDLEFVLDLYKNKNIKIANSDYIFFKFDLKDEEIIEKIKRIENNLTYLKGAAKVLKRLHFPLNLVLVKDVIKDEENVCRVDEIINNGQLIKLEEVESNTIINPIKLLGYIFLIYFVKQENGAYKGYDFLHNDYICDKLIIEETKPVRLSRYFNLSCDILANMIIDEYEIISEIKKCTKNEITISYINNLMLEVIKSYDIKTNKKYLNIAIKINRILRRYRQFYSEDLFKLNKYQILKRLNKLSDEDKNKILKIKLDDTKEKLFRCSCCLLLDDYDEFYIYFESLDTQDQKLYITWPIYNLLPKDYKDKILKKINL